MELQFIIYLLYYNLFMTQQFCIIFEIIHIHTNTRTNTNVYSHILVHKYKYNFENKYAWNVHVQYMNDT